VQWLCGISSRSVRGTRSVAVYCWVLVRDWYRNSGFVVVNRGPCLEQEQWLYSSVFRSVLSTIAVAVSNIMVRGC
jgi:hypothetical protein